MKKFIKEYIKKFGYNPNIYELHNLYTQGVLRLSDIEENTLIKEYSTYLELGYYNYYYNNKTKQTK
tara:strand:- start:584 stop:781 length:198 start_codon:yes stop_codon:yes gene_type:complete